MTRATEITIAGIAGAIICLGFLLIKDYYVALAGYLVVIMSDVLDGREARRSGVSRWGHFCDRLVRDPLLILIVYSLMFFYGGSQRSLAWLGLAVEAFFFAFNMVCCVKGIPESRSFYLFWNYGKQSVYSLAGLFMLFVKLENPTAFFSIGSFAILGTIYLESNLALKNSEFFSEERSVG